MTVLPNQNRWMLLCATIAALILITLDNSILYTALPTLSRELGASPDESLWIINAYPLVMSGLLLGAGTLGDRIGHRQMMLIGLVLFGVASLAAAFSPTPSFLIAARAFLAVGAAAMMPATLALIRTTFTDERERTMAIAIWGSMSLVGIGLGPILSGLLLEWFWWGSVFLINVPVVLIALAGVMVFAPRQERKADRPWDGVSSALAVLVIGGLVFAIKSLAKADPDWIILGSACCVIVVGGIIFVRRQKWLTHPSLDFGLFRNPAFSAGVVAAMITLFSFAGLQLAATQRFQLVVGFSPVEAGLLVAVVALGAMPMALLGGALLHRLGLQALISGGLGVAAIAVLCVAISLNLSIGWLIASILAVGIGLGAVISVASTAIVGSAPIDRAGMAASVEEIAFEFGALIAVALLGSLMAAIYTASVVLPVGSPMAAKASLAGALAAADAGGASAGSLTVAATAAFDHAYLTVLFVIATVLGVGAILTAVLLRQFGPGSSATIHPH